MLTLVKFVRISNQCHHISKLKKHDILHKKKKKNRKLNKNNNKTKKYFCIIYVYFIM